MKFLISILIVHCFLFGLGQNGAGFQTKKPSLDTSRQNLDYLIRQADSCFKIGKFISAKEIYYQAYLFDTTLANKNAIIGLVRSNDKLGIVSNDIALYKKALLIDSQHLREYGHKLAAIYESKLMYNEAANVLRLNYRIDSTNWNLASKLTDLLLMVNRQYEADSIIHNALVINPDICLLKYKIGGVKYLLSQYDSSIFYIKMAFATCDTSYPYLKTLGLDYFGNENYDSAICYLKRYISLAGADEKVYATLGNIYSEKLQIDSSIYFMDKAYKLGVSPNYFNNAKSLAFYNEKKGNKDKALNLYYMLYFTNKDEEACYSIAKIEDGRKNYTTALAWYERYLESDGTMYKELAKKRKMELIKITNDANSKK